MSHGPGRLRYRSRHEPVHGESLRERDVFSAGAQSDPGDPGFQRRSQVFAGGSGRREFDATINPKSLTVEDRVSDKDRQEIERTMNQQVLETDRYPEIVYESSKVAASKAGNGQYFLNLVGDLSLHGTTKPEPISVQVAVVGDTLRAHGEFTILQTAYGIKPVSIAGGSIKLKDELKLSFDILARKEKDGG